MKQALHTTMKAGVPRHKNKPEVMVQWAISLRSRDEYNLLELSGLEGSLVVRRLKGIKKNYSPYLLFLIETKNPDDVDRNIAAQLDYDYVKCVSPLEIGGGLALLWKKSVSICFLSFDARLIDCKISNKDVSFYLSCIFGHHIGKLHTFYKKDWNIF